MRSWREEWTVFWATIALNWGLVLYWVNSWTNIWSWNRWNRWSSRKIMIIIDILIRTWICILRSYHRNRVVMITSNVMDCWMKMIWRYLEGSRMMGIDNWMERIEKGVGKGKIERSLMKVGSGLIGREGWGWIRMSSSRITMNMLKCF